MRVYYDPETGNISHTVAGNEHGPDGNAGDYIEVEDEEFPCLSCYRVIDGELLRVRAEPEQDLTPITRRQLRLTLVRNGFALDDVAALIEAMPDGLARDEALIEWADATTFDRHHPTLILIGGGLGLTAEQIDTLWIEALAA